MRLQIQIPTMERCRFLCNGEHQPTMLFFASGKGRPDRTGQRFSCPAPAGFWVHRLTLSAKPFAGSAGRLIECVRLAEYESWRYLKAVSNCSGYWQFPITVGNVCPAESWFTTCFSCRLAQRRKSFLKRGWNRLWTGLTRFWVLL